MRTNTNTLQALEQWFQDDSFYSPSSILNGKNLLLEGQKKALNLFHEASRRVPAYKKFLEEQGIKAEDIKIFEDFTTLPATTKENYIEKYSAEERCWDGILDNMHMISTSSGTTGEPHFWPRDIQTEIEGAYPHEFFLKSIFNIDKKKTLFVNGFAMGNWIAGTFTLGAMNLVAWKGYPVTIMTPGYSLEAILQVIEKLQDKFEQIIITGHTPFLKEVVENLKITKPDKIKLLGTGQGITERWRGYICEILKSEDYYHTFANLYGSADAALMGFETSLSIYLRKLLSDDHPTAHKIFNDMRLPSLYNYDPRLIFFESVHKQLHITKNSGCPLIRYNIQDEGGLLEYSEMISHFGNIEDVFKDEKLNIFQSELPFVYLFGRDKFMVKIYGANVYSEHVQHALTHPDLQKHITGRFVLESEEDDKHNPQMVCRVELSMNVDPHEDIRTQIESMFVEEVRKINSEYDFVLNKLGNKVKPKIILHEHGHPQYFPKDKVKKNA